MKRLLPSPLTSATLFVAWPMLAGSWSAGQLLLGGVLALLIPLWTGRLQAQRPRLRAPFVALRLALVVLWDIVVSNIDVARRILGPEAAIRPGWVWVPIDIRDPHGLVALAGIVTMTPGTLSARIDADGRRLLVHALDAGDPAATAATIKARYEAPLIRIFDGAGAGGAA